jgi:hypothetical protein
MAPPESWVISRLHYGNYRGHWALVMWKPRRLMGTPGLEAFYQKPRTSRPKRLCRAMLEFKSMKTAYATIKVFEVMRMIRKQQCITLPSGITGEVCFFAKLFGIFA